MCNIIFVCKNICVTNICVHIKSANKADSRLQVMDEAECLLKYLIHYTCVAIKKMQKSYVKRQFCLHRFYIRENSYQDSFSTIVYASIIHNNYFLNNILFASCLNMMTSLSFRYYTKREY